MMNNELKPKTIETIEEVPWVEYMEINETTGERKLSRKAPKDIKKEYKKYNKKFKNKRSILDIILRRKKEPEMISK